MKGRKIKPEVTVGVLVLVGIVILFFMSFRISRLERIKGDVYTALFPSVSGLVINAGVEVAGVPVGRVEKIALEQGMARVTMRIGQVRLHEDAVANIRTSGVLGDKFIEVKTGTPDAPLLPPGGAIKNVQAAADIDRLIKSVESAASNFGELGKSLQDMFGGEEGEAIKNLVSNINAVSSELRELIAENRGKVDAIVSNIEKFSQELPALSQKAEKTLSNLEKISADVKEGKGTLGKLLADDTIYNDINEIMASIRRITARIESGEGTLGKLIADDTLYEEATKTMKKVQKASEGIQEQTPITVLGSLAGLFF